MNLLHLFTSVIFTHQELVVTWENNLIEVITLSGPVGASDFVSESVFNSVVRTCTNRITPSSNTETTTLSSISISCRFLKCLVAPPVAHDKYPLLFWKLYDETCSTTSSPSTFFSRFIVFTASASAPYLASAELKYTHSWKLLVAANMSLSFIISVPVWQGLPSLNW